MAEEIIGHHNETHKKIRKIESSIDTKDARLRSLRVKLQQSRQKASEAGNTVEQDKI